MMESGLSIVGDVRDMGVLSKNGKAHILVAKNDEELQLIQVNESGRTVVTPETHSIPCWTG